MRRKPKYVQATLLAPMDKSQKRGKRKRQNKERKEGEREKERGTKRKERRSDKEEVADAALGTRKRNLILGTQQAGRKNPRI